MPALLQYLLGGVDGRVENVLGRMAHVGHRRDLGARLQAMGLRVGGGCQDEGAGAVNDPGRAAGVMPMINLQIGPLFLDHLAIGQARVIRRAGP